MQFKEKLPNDRGEMVLTITKQAYRTDGVHATGLKFEITERNGVAVVKYVYDFDMAGVNYVFKAYYGEGLVAIPDLVFTFTFKPRYNFTLAKIVDLVKEAELNGLHSVLISLMSYIRDHFEEYLFI